MFNYLLIRILVKDDKFYRVEDKSCCIANNR